jgi:hypothetical protein
MITRLATENDFQGILDLQERNLFELLSDSEKENGFVTTRFTSSQLKEILDERGLFVGECDGKILGYTMAAGWDYFSQWPIFPFMISRLFGYDFDGTIVSDQNTFQYGPICVDAGLRGTDAFRRIFEEMRIGVATRYPVGVTFINKVNDRSYKAHTRKLGMVVVDEFEFSGREYYGLAFDTARSVLQ